METELCGCDYLECIEKRKAAGEASDSVLLEYTPEERHEFHMLDSYTAYCLCGWVASEYSSLNTPGWITQHLGERYRKHHLD